MIIKYIINLSTTFFFGKSMYMDVDERNYIQSWIQGMIDTQIMSLHSTPEVIIQLSGSCLYSHMTGEVIIQLPR
jgi:hypothetical protein